MPIKNKVKTVSATEAKLHLGQYLDEVYYGDQTVIVEKMGKQIAQIIPLEEKKEKNDKNPWHDVFGMWKDKKPDPIKELEKGRRLESHRTKELEDLGKNISKRK